MSTTHRKSHPPSFILLYLHYTIQNAKCYKLVKSGKFLQLPPLQSLANAAVLQQLFNNPRTVHREMLMLGLAGTEPREATQNHEVHALNQRHASLQASSIKRLRSACSSTCTALSQNVNSNNKPTFKVVAHPASHTRRTLARANTPCTKCAHRQLHSGVHESVHVAMSAHMLGYPNTHYSCSLVPFCTQPDAVTSLIRCPITPMRMTAWRMRSHAPSSHSHTTATPHTWGAKMDPTPSSRPAVRSRCEKPAAWYTPPVSRVRWQPPASTCCRGSSSDWVSRVVRASDQDAPTCCDREQHVRDSVKGDGVLCCVG